MTQQHNTETGFTTEPLLTVDARRATRRRQSATDEWVRACGDGNGALGCWCCQTPESTKVEVHAARATPEAGAHGTLMTHVIHEL